MRISDWSSDVCSSDLAFITNAKEIAVDVGILRARAPQDGDYWRGCDDARAAGTAPSYRGEPGYRDGMDGDSDGIACEPYRCPLENSQGETRHTAVRSLVSANFRLRFQSGRGHV